MKKTIATALSLVAFTVLSTGLTLAQGAYSRPFDARDTYHSQSQNPHYSNNDQIQDELKIDRIDAIVGLSRRQEKQLRGIETNYDHIMATSRMTPDGLRQIQLRKRQDVLAVLTSAQRDRLFAFQQNTSHNNRPAPYGRRG